MDDTGKWSFIKLPSFPPLMLHAFNYQDNKKTNSLSPAIWTTLKTPRRSVPRGRHYILLPIVDEGSEKYVYQSRDGDRDKTITIKRHPDYRSSCVPRHVLEHRNVI